MREMADGQRPLEFKVVDAPELGGWVVVNAATLKVIEPGYLWSTREQATAWASRELERLRVEALEFQRGQDAIVERGLARSWAAQHETGRS
jgi:hypothetical protein